jgi:holo-[acyl-carrier protein] synthase
MDAVGAGRSVPRPSGRFIVSPSASRIGLDLVDVDRFAAALANHPRLEERLFTPAEVAYCRRRGRPVLHLAARFAAKEAVGKLLGTGVLCWRDIEVVGEPGAAPAVTLSGATAQRAAALGIAEIRVSLSHVDSLAGACVMAVASSYEGADDGPVPDGR